MIQEIAPRVYNPTFIQGKSPKPYSYLIYFKSNKVLLKNASPFDIPTFSGFENLVPNIYENAIYLFSIDNMEYYLIRELPDFKDESNVFSYQELILFRSFSPNYHAFAVITASQIYRWINSRKFCGHCGNENEMSKSERALVCPKCKATEYPKISPAVIVAIIDREKDKILLTKYKLGYPYYALVAGYIEIGETPEETVIREVKEEVGINIKNLKPYKIQPWSYSDALMLGFVAELDGSSELNIQKDELEFAGWFTRKEVPKPEFTISLGHELMKKFKENSL